MDTLGGFTPFFKGRQFHFDLRTKYFQKQVFPERKEFAPLRNIFLSFRIDPLLTKQAKPFLIGLPPLQVYLSPLTISHKSGICLQDKFPIYRKHLHTVIDRIYEMNKSNISEIQEIMFILLLISYAKLNSFALSRQGCRGTAMLRRMNTLNVVYCHLYS